jgi:preprotein translocase SecE subunit
MMDYIKKAINYFEGVKQEAKKVTWPTKAELMQAGTLVLVSILVCSIILSGAELLIHKIIQTLINIGK